MTGPDDKRCTTRPFVASSNPTDQKGSTVEWHNGPIKLDHKMGGLSRCPGKEYVLNLKTEIVLELLKEDKRVSQLVSGHGFHCALIRWGDQAIDVLPELLSDQDEILGKLRGEYGTKIQRF